MDEIMEIMRSMMKETMVAMLQMTYDDEMGKKAKDLEKSLAESGVKAKVHFSIDIEDIDVDKFENAKPNKEGKQ